MTVTNLLEWQNLVFVLPIVLALVLLGLSLLGSLGDHDVNVDHDVGMDHDIDHDVDVHVGGDNAMPHDLDHDIDTSHDVSTINLMLSALGIGKVPLSILGFCWLMIFGFVGITLNAVWKGLFDSINILVIISAGIALFSSLTLTGFLAKLIAKVMPKSESYGETLSDFINREAEVRYTVTSSSGTITLYDKYHNLQTLVARLDPSCKDAIPPDTKVLILSYSSQDGEFLVIPASQLSK